MRSVGLGPGQSLFNLAVQNTVPPHQLGVATASSQFVRQIGQTVGVAVFGAVITTSLASDMARHTPPGASVRHLDLGDLQHMALARRAHPNVTPQPAEQAAERMVRQSFSTAIVHCLYLGLGVLSLGLLIMLQVPEAPLSERRAIEATRRDDAA